MRLVLTAVVAGPGTSARASSDTGPRLDVLLDLEPTHLVSEVEVALTGLMPPTSSGLWLGTRPLSPTDSVARAGLRSGCVLSLGGPSSVGHDKAGVTQLHVVSGPDAGAVHPLTAGDVTVGRGAAISLDDPEVAPEHLRLHVGPAGVVATDLGGGVRRAGVPIDGPTPLGAADHLELGGNLLAVVAAGQQAATHATLDCAVEVNRPPRLRPSPIVSTVALPAPPTPREPRRLAILPLLLPVILGVVMALVASPLFLLFTLMSPILALHSWASDRKTGRAAGRKDQQAYADETAAAELEIAVLAAAETAARRTACPDPAAILLTAVGPGRRLWERRWDDEDRLLLRVGTGIAEAEAVRVTGPPTRPRPAQPQLRDVPITVNLRDVGVLGVAGPPATVRALARALVGQLVVLHSPRDLSLVLLTDDEAGPSERDWGWLRWLPHSAGQDCAALVGTTPDSLARRVFALNALMAARTADARSHRPTLPDVVVVVDGARRLRALTGMTALLRDGPALGVHLICLDEQERLLPSECQAVVVCEGGAALTLNRGQPQHARGDFVPVAWAEQVARALSPLRDATPAESQSALPTSARLLDVLSLDPPSGATVRAHWSRRGRTTKAVVGLCTDGPFTLDLSRDGPHVLVAGTTGAGKSEFLQTLVASLAVANRPDAMNFVLIDYKGGAAFKDCARLPHTVGLVTDLDSHLVERALASLTAELKAREQVLAVAGAKDLEDYWLAGAPEGALARLVIVIDEFASLVEELPDFVRGLVGIAQRGRSLGIHLVLATQRPSGVVSPEIRANTNLRVALRVTDAAESLDVLDAAGAAAIPRSTPGRGYARTGHASLTAFQTARIGGRTPGAVTSAVTAQHLGWSDVGLPLPTSSQLAPENDETDLHALVEAVREAARDLDLPAARSPWLEALPDVLTLADAQADVVPASQGTALPPVVYGLEDVPDQQTRRAAALDLEYGGHLLIAGAPRSGRSTLLRTLAASLAMTLTPADAHLYALDCGNGALQQLAGLPHCGAVVSRQDVERADRLLTRLTAEVAHRQQLLSENGYADLAEQRAAAREPLPYLVLLVDRWEGFLSAFEEVDAGRMTESFLRLLHEGPGVGLRVVVTGDRSLLMGKVASAVQDVLCLRLAERSDYSLAGLSPRLMPDSIPTGRCFRGGSGLEVQVALLDHDCSGTAQNAALAAVVDSQPAGGPRPFRVDALPSRVSVDDVPHADSAGPLWALVGLGGDELAGQGIDLAESGPGFVIGGPARSGRSSALLVIAQSLLRAGTPVIVLAPRPSPLRELASVSGVLSVFSSSDPEPAEVARALSDGPCAVLVDDAELLLSTRVSELLEQVVRDGRDQGHCLIAAGTTDVLATAFRGFTYDARRSRSGLLLSPDSHLHGELLGVRLPRSAVFDGPPGRGLLVRDGRVMLVQVPVP